MSFGGVRAIISGEVKAIDNLLAWSGGLPGNYPWRLRELRTSTPFLDFVMVAKHGLTVVPQKRQLVLIFGAASPSVSPLEQIVGDFAESPSAVATRIHQHVLHYSKQCLGSGDLERAGSYGRVLEAGAKATDDIPLRKEAASILLQVARGQLELGESSRAIQSFLHLRQSTFSELGDTQLVAEMSYYQGVAAQRLEAQGDMRFDPQFYFEFCIDTFPPGIESEILDEAKKCLAANFVHKAVDLDDTDRLNELGDQFDQQGNVDLAEQMYRKSATLGSRGGTLKLGMLLEKLERDDEAEVFYRQAADLGVVTGMNLLGMLLEKQARDDEAEEVLRTGAAHGSAFSVSLLGVLFEGQGKDAEAEDMYRKGADLGDETGSTLLNNLLKKRERDEAMKQYRARLRS